jgi:hypothetical protein
VEPLNGVGFGPRAVMMSGLIVSTVAASTSTIADEGVDSLSFAQPTAAMTRRPARRVTMSGRRRRDAVLAPRSRAGDAPLHHSELSITTR